MSGIETTVTCSICMNSFDKGDGDYPHVLKCGHVYHGSCLLEWKNASKKMECPECRSKYTTRTLKKIFLHYATKDDDEETPQYLELQREKLLSANLQRDNKLAQFEKEQMTHELLKSRDELQNLMQEKSKLRDEYAVKCQAYELISVVNDEYLKVNNSLRTEYTHLEQHNEKLKREIIELKSQQLKASKPFVDLTADDDSDVEIIDDKKPDMIKIPESGSLKTSEVVIEVDDDTAEPKVETNEAQQVTEIFSIFDGLDMKNTFSNVNCQELQDFEKFILDQM